jgi:hypothetical protein
METAMETAKAVILNAPRRDFALWPIDTFSPG